MGDYSVIGTVLMSTLPALCIGLMALYLFKGYIKQENKRQQFTLQKQLSAQALPTRLQAYERLTLLLERISLKRLLLRVTPLNSDLEGYIQLLLQTIEQEFEHNLSQQIYVSADCWRAIVQSKLLCMQHIRKAGATAQVTSSDQLREVILKQLVAHSSPTEHPLALLQEEAKTLF
ncbi:MAG: hypothetical protein P8I32_01835 [Flavobacteriaceae bacterium]|nr:hypothetical protein [Flavobacteriaceae bacterium]